MNPLPSPGEITRSLSGAWRLFLNRADAMRLFDVSLGGFWRSFAAIILVLPLSVAVAMAERAARLAQVPTATPFSEPAFWSAWLVGLTVDWVTFPALLALGAGFLGVGRTYTAFVVARNWGGVIETVPQAAWAALVVAGLLSSEIAEDLYLALLIVVLRYHYLIVRHALQAPVALAIALVIADFLLSLLIGRGVDLAFGI